VFLGLLAHEFSVRWMKNRRLVAPICLVTLICRAHSECYCFKLGITLPFLAISFPHRLLPSDALLPREAIREATSPLHRAPSLHVSSSSPIRLLGVVCYCQSSRGTCVFGACSPCLCRRRGDSRGDLAARPAPSLCVASLSPNRLLAPRLPLLEVWRYLRSPLCSLDIKFVALFSCCCVDLCSSYVP